MKVDNTGTDRCTQKTNTVAGDLKCYKDFSAGKCTFAMHHNGKFAGQVLKLTHICRVCWSKLTEKKLHRAWADECQFTKPE